MTDELDPSTSAKERDLARALESTNAELRRVSAALSACQLELQERDRALERAHGDLTNLLNEADLSVLMLDAELNVRRISPAAQRLFALSPSDTTRSFPALAARQGFADLASRVAHVFDSFASEVFETVDERGRWFRVSIRPYKLRRTVDGVVLFLMDIDELKRTVRDVRAAHAHAEHGSRARDDLLAILSHELRTPLSTILSQAQMLRRGVVVQPQLTAAYEAIERGAKAQAQLIDDLLDASRIVSDRWQMEVQVCDLHSIVAGALGQLGRAAQQRSIELEADLDEDVGFVWSEPARARQVVTKLVGNAIKFTPPGGRISVSLGHEGGHAVLRVSDTGAGIAADFLPHVFDRLKQLDSGITRRHGGLGLGLAIVRQVIESLGGTVKVVSPGLGQGSTFTASFPKTGFAPDDAAIEGLDLRDSVHSLNRPGRARDYGELRGLRVLVLDDDPATLKAVSDVFWLSGAIVCAAASTADALSSVDSFEPQLMVCDISMPESDGYAFIQQLRARGPSRGGDTPALALTALSGAADRQRAIAAGYQQHMAKPVDIDLLRDLVVELLQTTRATQH